LIANEKTKDSILLDFLNLPNGIFYGKVEKVLLVSNHSEQETYQTSALGIITKILVNFKQTWCRLSSSGR
jgi:hypothetical protein